MNVSTLPERLKSFISPVWIIVLVLLIILGVIGSSFYSQYKIRSRVALSKQSLRSLMTANEIYYLDNMQYPSCTINKDLDVDYVDDTIVVATRTYRGRGEFKNSTLTTPIAYLKAFPKDPFSDQSQYTFRYFNNPQSYMIGSFGPDSDHQTGGDIMWDTPENPVITDKKTESAENQLIKLYLINFPEKPFVTKERTKTGLNTRTPPTSLTYDPTNGTVSEGDIWVNRE